MSIILNAFGLNVLNNGHSEDAIHKACIERQKELFNYHFFDYDSPEVKDTIKKYNQFFQDCVKIGRINTFANLVRIIILLNYKDYLYMDTDIYPYWIGETPGILNGSSFAVMLGDEKWLEELLKKYNNYNGNPWDYVDRIVSQGLDIPKLDCNVVHFTKYNPEQCKNGIFKGHQDFIAKSYEELMAIKNTPTKLKKKVFTSIPELKRYSCKEMAVHIVPENILIIYEEVYR